MDVSDLIVIISVIMDLIVIIVIISVAKERRK